MHKDAKARALARPARRPQGASCSEMRFMCRMESAQVADFVGEWRAACAASTAGRRLGEGTCQLSAIFECHPTRSRPVGPRALRENGAPRLRSRQGISRIDFRRRRHRGVRGPGASEVLAATATALEPVRGRPRHRPASGLVKLCVPPVACVMPRPQRVMFSEFRSESRAGNIVNLEAPTDMLLGCLKHGAQASSTVMKLSKRHGSPSLSCVVSVSHAAAPEQRTPASLAGRRAIPVAVLCSSHGPLGRCCAAPLEVSTICSETTASH